MHGRAAMEQRINQLFRKYILNTCTPEELEEFLHFVRMSEHDEVLRKIIGETYDAVLIGSDTYVNQSGDLILPDVPAGIPFEKKSGISALIVTYAAVLCLITAFLLWHREPGSGNASVAYLKKTRTERAEYKYILLPDSTQVWLNAGSTLEYPDRFDGNKREVSLSGEAYFDVKHAAEQPFIIHTGEISTTVLGTAFNINAYNDRPNVTVSVSRGKVRVSRGDRLIATLLKDQEIKVNQKNSSQLQQVIKTNAVAAWQQGNLVYDDETMGEIIEDLQRVYNVEINIMDEKIRAVRLSTRFRRELGIAQALEILCKLTDTKLSEENGSYFIQ